MEIKLFPTIEFMGDVFASLAPVDDDNSTFAANETILSNNSLEEEGVKRGKWFDLTEQLIDRYASECFR